MNTQSGVDSHSSLSKPNTRRFILAAVAVLTMTALSGVAGAAEADGTAQDQQALLVQLNLARWDPAGFEAASGIDVAGALPRPPLAVNPDLSDAASFKADEIADHGYFSHQSAVTGDWPNELVRSFGYDLPGYFPDDANNIESLHSGSPDPFAVLGSLIGSPGHRPHVLGEGWFGTHHEVGIGRSEAENVWAIHTAYREGLGALVTGTVFDDLDADGIMDAGEGLPGITVTVRGAGSTVTNGGGGYSIEVPGGSHRITAEGPGFSGTSSGAFTVIGYNIGADFVSGAGAPVIRDYQLCGGREPTILGTDGDDVIYGTDGRDIIHGLGGDDVIYGLRGNDVICGGNGADVVRGGGGRDRIIGGSSDDTLRGGWRDDTLKGGWGEDTLAGGGGEDTCLAGEWLTGCP